MFNKTLTARWRPATRIAAPFAVGVAVALTPVPQGLSANAWHYFALFAAVIVGTIAEPVPAAAVGLAGVVIAAVLGLVHTSTTEATRWALSGFSNLTIWLIFAAYMFAVGYSKTGLGKRIALLLIQAMGKRTLGLGYAIALADLALAPMTPSNTARSAGTIYPIIRNIPELYGSRPGEEGARKIGAYLMYTALAVQCVTSSMFLTALAPNLLAVSLIAETADVTISWMDWFNSPWWNWHFSSGAQRLVRDGYKRESARKSGLLTNLPVSETLQEHANDPEAEKEEVPAVLEAPRRSHAHFPAQNQAQIERRDVNQQPLEDVAMSPQMRPPHSARVVDMRKASFH